MTERTRVRTEPANRRLRAIVDGITVVDTTNPMYVWEVPYYPTYYIPTEDVRSDLLVETGETKRSPSRGTATVLGIDTGDRVIEDAAYRYDEPKIEDLAGHVALRWDAMDHWFEEDAEVFVHAKDPNTRVDILPSSRNVRVEIDGETVADSNSAMFLHETNLPVRYYLPKTDVRLDLMTPTDTVSRCPYKGTARYWSVGVGDTAYEDIVWGYDAPTTESARIAGRVSFYNEKVDIYIDGELRERPKTKFS